MAAVASSTATALRAACHVHRIHQPCADHGHRQTGHTGQRLRVLATGRKSPGLKILGLSCSVGLLAVVLGSGDVQVMPVPHPSAIAPLAAAQVRRSPADSHMLQCTIFIAALCASAAPSSCRAAGSRPCAARCCPFELQTGLLKSSTLGVAPLLVAGHWSCACGIIAAHCRHREWTCAHTCMPTFVHP